MAGCYQKTPLGVRYLDEIRRSRRRTLAGPVRDRAYDLRVTSEDAPEPVPDDETDDQLTGGVAQERSGFTTLDLDSRLLHTLAGAGLRGADADPGARRSRRCSAGRDLLGQARDRHRQDRGVRAAAPAAARTPRDRRPARAGRALVLVPTRELAMQVAEAMHRYGRDARRARRCRSTAASRSAASCARSSAASTSSSPRRAARSTTSAAARSTSTSVAVVVLDEADEMLDMGFAEDLEAILEATPPRSARRRSSRPRCRRASPDSPSAT